MHHSYETIISNQTTGGGVIFIILRWLYLYCGINKKRDDDDDDDSADNQEFQHV